MTRSPQERVALAQWTARSREQKRLGLWEPFVPAAPVREHLESIRRTGMPVRATAVRLGLPYSAFEYLLWGDRNHPPGEQVSRETAEVLMAFWPALKDFPDRSRIDPTGTRRRVQALEVLGFSQKFIGERIGMRKSSFALAMNADRVTARLARAVAAQYDELWNRTPESLGVQQWVADRTRRAAARGGLFGPLAWDDDTIDDPDAVPQTDAAPPGFTEGGDVVARWLMGESVVLDHHGRREVIAHLMEWSTASLAEIADRMEMSAPAVEQSWERTKRKARKAGRPVPWRRMYVSLSDMNLTKDDMGSAA